MAAKSVEAYLYVLGGEGGPCKVGWAQNVKRRAQYVRAPAGTVDVAHMAPIPYKMALYAERYAHWLLKDHHFRNEWFNVTSAIAIDAVNKAVALDFKKTGRIPPLLESNMMARLPAGTWKVIDANLYEGEKRSDLIREAIDRELKRRARRS